MTNENNINEDNILNKLILMSQDNPKKLFERPDEKTISAYLLGNATESQKEVIHKAVLRSKPFKKEILDMIDDLEELKKNETQTENISRNLNEVPNYQNFLSKYEQKPDIDNSNNRNSFWNKIVDISKLKSFQVSVVAVAAIVILAIIPFNNFNDSQIAYGEWTTFIEDVEPGLLITNQTRNVSLEQESFAFEKPLDAALDRFRSIVNYDKSGFAVDTNSFLSKPLNFEHEIVINCYNLSNNKSETINTSVPDLSSTKSEPVNVWFLELPNGSIYNYTLHSDSANIRWHVNMKSNGVITFTYLDSTKYKATTVYFIDLK